MTFTRSGTPPSNDRGFSIYKYRIPAMSYALALMLALCGLGACRGYAPDSKIEDGSRNPTAAVPVRGASRDASPAQPSDYGYSKGSPSPVAASGDETNDASEQVSVPSSVTGAHTDAKVLEAGQILANGQYLIKNSSSKKCLHVPGGKRDNSVKIVQSSCEASPENKFSIDLVEHKFYRFTNIANSKSLQITDELAQDEATVEQSDYLGQAYQQWVILGLEDGTYSLKPRENLGLCLDVIYGSEADNAGIQIWHECSGISQKWLLVPIY